MSYRRIATITAVLAAGAALVPALAFAGDAPQPTARGANMSNSPLTAEKLPGSRRSPVHPARPFSRLSRPPVRRCGGRGEPDPHRHGRERVLVLHQLPSSRPGTPVSATVDWGDTTTSSGTLSGTTVTASHTYEKLGTYTVTVTVTDNESDTVVNTVTVTTAGSDYTAYGPTRVLDTRYGTGAPKAPVKARSVTQVKFAGNGGIPADVTAVVLNVTVTEPTAAGFVTVYGDGTARPTSSNVNFVKGQTVPNQVIAPVGADGKVDFYNASTGSTDLIADVAGYFTQTASSGYSSLTPYRLVDTRYGTGEPKRQLAGKGSFAVQIAGNDGGKLPASGITAVALNITSTGSQGAGFLTAYADGTKTPTASNVNFTANQTIANSVITPVAAATARSASTTAAPRPQASWSTSSATTARPARAPMCRRSRTACWTRVTRAGSTDR